MPKFRKNVVARCSQGTLGLITHDDPQEVSYPDGSTGTAWVGVHLTNKTSPTGSPWSSRGPGYVGTAEEILCCQDFRGALGDRLLDLEPGLGTCIVNGSHIIPIGFCPWCGKERPKTLATSPAMLYRP